MNRARAAEVRFEPWPTVRRGEELGAAADDRVRQPRAGGQFQNQTAGQGVGARETDLLIIAGPGHGKLKTQLEHVWAAAANGDQITVADGLGVSRPAVQLSVEQDRAGQRQGQRGGTFGE